MTIDKKSYNRKLLLIDFLAMVPAFVLGLTLRIGNFFKMHNWMKELYSFAFVLIIFIMLLSYMFRKRTDETLAEMDPVENLVEVVRNWAILMVLLALSLFLTQNGGKYSRKAFLYFAVLGVVINYIFRMIWRISLARENVHIRPIRRILLLTDKENARLLVGRLLAEKNKTIELIGISIPDAEMAGEHIGRLRVVGDRNDPTGLSAMHNGKEYEEVFIYLPQATDDEKEKWVRFFEEREKAIHLDLAFCGQGVRSRKLLGSVGCYQTVRIPSFTERCDVLGIPFAVGDVDSAVLHVRDRLTQLKGRYITFSNVHTTVMAQEDDAYDAVQKKAAIIFPDGAPIAWQERTHGFPQAERIAGPDFMEAMFRETMDGSVRHYFYGASIETIVALKMRLEKLYPGVVIAGMYSPPFRELTPEEDEADIERIHGAKPDIVWVGLGAPKQENWMAAHDGRVNAVMIGVGAGFDFHAGRIKRAPRWVQKLSMEWFYRLLQDPKRLFNRYFVTNFKFMRYLLTKR